MKQSLQLRLGQKLTMTPQLQQAIKLLQLSTLDMQQEIQQALDSNYMLEVEDDGEDDSFSEPLEILGLICKFGIFSLIAESIFNSSGELSFS